MVTKCPRCNVNVPDKLDFCPKCGMVKEKMAAYRKTHNSDMASRYMSDYETEGARAKTAQSKRGGHAAPANTPASTPAATPSPVRTEAPAPTNPPEEVKTQAPEATQRTETQTPVKAPSGEE